MPARRSRRTRNKPPEVVPKLSNEDVEDDVVVNENETVNDDVKTKDDANEKNDDDVSGDYKTKKSDVFTAGGGDPSSTKQEGPGLVSKSTTTTKKQEAAKTSRRSKRPRRPTARAAMASSDAPPGRKRLRASNSSDDDDDDDDDHNDDATRSSDDSEGEGQEDEEDLDVTLQEHEEITTRTKASSVSGRPRKSNRAKPTRAAAAAPNAKRADGGGDDDDNDDDITSDEHDGDPAENAALGEESDDSSSSESLKANGEAANANTVSTQDAGDDDSSDNVPLSVMLKRRKDALAKKQQGKGTLSTTSSPIASNDGDDQSEPDRPKKPQSATASSEDEVDDEMKNNVSNVDSKKKLSSFKKGRKALARSNKRGAVARSSGDDGGSDEATQKQTKRRGRPRKGALNQSREIIDTPNATTNDEESSDDSHKDEKQRPRKPQKTVSRKIKGKGTSGSGTHDVDSSDESTAKEKKGRSRQRKVTASQSKDKVTPAPTIDDDHSSDGSRKGVGRPRKQVARKRKENESFSINANAEASSDESVKDDKRGHERPGKTISSSSQSKDEGGDQDEKEAVAPPPTSILSNGTADDNMGSVTEKASEADLSHNSRRSRRTRKKPNKLGEDNSPGHISNDLTKSEEIAAVDELTDMGTRGPKRKLSIILGDDHAAEVITPAQKKSKNQDAGESDVEMEMKEKVEREGDGSARAVHSASAHSEASMQDDDKGEDNHSEDIKGEKTINATTNDSSLSEVMDTSNMDVDDGNVKKTDVNKTKEFDATASPQDGRLDSAAEIEYVELDEKTKLATAEAMKDAKGSKELDKNIDAADEDDSNGNTAEESSAVIDEADATVQVHVVGEGHGNNLNKSDDGNVIIETQLVQDGKTPVNPETQRDDFANDHTTKIFSLVSDDKPRDSLQDSSVVGGKGEIQDEPETVKQSLTSEMNSIERSASYDPEKSNEAPPNESVIATKTVTASLKGFPSTARPTPFQSNPCTADEKGNDLKGETGLSVEPVFHLVVETTTPSAILPHNELSDNCDHDSNVEPVVPAVPDLKADNENDGDQFHDAHMELPRENPSFSTKNNGASQPTKRPVEGMTDEKKREDASADKTELSLKEESIDNRDSSRITEDPKDLKKESPKALSVLESGDNAASEPVEHSPDDSFILEGSRAPIQTGATVPISSKSTGQIQENDASPLAVRNDNGETTEANQAVCRASDGMEHDAAENSKDISFGEADETPASIALAEMTDEKKIEDASADETELSKPALKEEIIDNSYRSRNTKDPNKDSPQARSFVESGDNAASEPVEHSPDDSFILEGSGAPIQTCVTVTMTTKATDHIQGNDASPLVVRNDNGETTEANQTVRRASDDTELDAAENSKDNNFGEADDAPASIAEQTKRSDLHATPVKALESSELSVEPIIIGRIDALIDSNVKVVLQSAHYVPVAITLHGIAEASGEKVRGNAFEADTSIFSANRESSNATPQGEFTTMLYTSNKGENSTKYVVQSDDLVGRDCSKAHSILTEVGVKDPESTNCPRPNDHVSSNLVVPIQSLPQHRVSSDTKAQGSDGDADASDKQKPAATSTTRENHGSAIKTSYVQSGLVTSRQSPASVKSASKLFSIPFDLEYKVKFGPPIPAEQYPSKAMVVPRMDFVNEEKLKHVKTVLYAAGSTVHRGAGFERIFAEYWDAMALRLSDRLSSHTSERCQRAIDNFLKTAKLRKLHNKFIVSIMRRATRSVVRYNEISVHLPVKWRQRVGRIYSQPSLSNQGQKPNAEVLVPESIHFFARESCYREAWDPDLPDPKPLGNEGRRQKKQLAPKAEIASASIPGALSVDPFVRKIALQSEMQVSELAMWLIAVSVKEHSINILRAAISQKESIDQGELAFPTLKFPTVLASTTKVASKKDGVQDPLKAINAENGTQTSRKLTALDLYAAVALMPCGNVGSLGGPMSRNVVERSLHVSYDQLPMVPNNDFIHVQHFITNQIFDEARTRTVPPKTRDDERDNRVSENTVNALRRTTVEQNSFAVPPPAQPRKLESPAVAQVPPKQVSTVQISDCSSVPAPCEDGEKELPRGMGRGAKNLAALIQQTSSSTPPAGQQNSSEDDDALKQRIESAGANSGELKSANATTESVAFDATPNEASDANDEADGQRRGKGFGIKNLAAMRARASNKN